MSHFLDDVISEIHTYFTLSNNALNDFNSDLWWAGQELRFGTIKNAGVRLQNASSHISAFINVSYNWVGSLHKSVYDGFDLLRDNWPEEDNGITMADILDAMDKAEPHQPLLFVSYLEAYKAATWNATFDGQFMASLVRKWTVWG